MIQSKTESSFSYGIAVYTSGSCTGSIPCISENKPDVARLVELLNGLAVEPCHFEDVVEDYLTDFSV